MDSHHRHHGWVAQHPQLRGTQQKLSLFQTTEDTTTEAKESQHRRIASFLIRYRESAFWNVALTGSCSEVFCWQLEDVGILRLRYSGRNKILLLMEIVRPHTSEVKETLENYGIELAYFSSYLLELLFCDYHVFSSSSPAQKRNSETLVLLSGWRRRLLLCWLKLFVNDAISKNWIAIFVWSFPENSLLQLFILAR